MSDAASEHPGCMAAMVEFGPFRYNAVRRELSDELGTVQIGSRALQLLEMFLENPGRLCSREELVARVWPRTVVEETSLRVHISALRRVLGDGLNGAKYIITVPGRGYSFVAKVRIATPVDSSKPSGSGHDSQMARRTPPPRLTRLIGRGKVIAQVGDLLRTERLVSIVGPGGMGKTTVGLAVAENVGPAHTQGWYFVDLSALTDSSAVVIELAQNCGLDIAHWEPWAAVEDALRNQQALIVLDNCEHLIDGVAALADRLLRTCPGLRILTTSREALEVESEWIFKLPPLRQPEPESVLSLEAVAAFPAVQLFVERSRASCHTFELTEANVSAVRQLCSFLDGIPLVIELAAARMDGLGEQGLLQRMENLFELLTRGRRTARSRHQTLNAVLNWSYELLTDTEKVVLQRLSVFSSTFDFEGAVAVASSPELSRQRAIDATLSLSAKSLVMTEVLSNGTPAYRLLYVTRLFAQRMLALTTAAPDVHRRHAVYLRWLLVRANRGLVELPIERNVVARPSLITDLRTAITWALVEENDLVVGMEIAAEATYMCHAAGLVDECRRYVVAAVDKIRRAGVEGTALEFKLLKTLTFVSAHLLAGGKGLEAVLERMQQLIPSVASVDEQLDALYASICNAYGQGDFLDSLAKCEELRELSTGEYAAVAVGVGERMSALNLHALGQHDAAERLALQVLRFDPSRLQLRFLSAVPIAVTMRMLLARIRWLRGEFQAAWTTLQEAFDHVDGSHGYAKCMPLGHAAIPMALWKGDLASATRWSHELLEHSTRTSLTYWLPFGKFFTAVVKGLPLLPNSHEVELLASNAHLADACVTIQSDAPPEATLARVRRGEVGWCAPEVLRLAAVSNFDSPVPGSREKCLDALGAALQLSEEQEARFWSLRILISRLDIALPGSSEAVSSRGQLQALLNTIDDGSSIPDLVKARSLFESGVQGPAASLSPASCQSALGQ